MVATRGRPNPEGAWIIRRVNGRKYSCADRETLQRWIVEGRVDRRDELSQHGDRWFRLGDSPELEFFFAARDRALLADETMRRYRQQSSRPTSHPASHSASRSGSDRRADMRLGPPAPRSSRSSGAHAATRKPIPLDDDESDHLVRRFERKRTARKLFAGVLGAALVVTAIGYSVAFVGPEDNPARLLAIRYGVLPGHAAATKTVKEGLERAHRAYERGDIHDLERAEQLYAQAVSFHSRDLEAAADRLLALTEYAGSQQRLSAGDQRVLETSADQKERARMLTTVRERTAKADTAQATAATLASKLEHSGGDTLAAHRALANYHRAQRDSGRMEQHLHRARELMQQSAKKDPWTLAIEAATAAPEPERANQGALEEAASKLEEALALNPGFAKARVQLARVLAAKGEPDRAEKELESVVREWPAYEEAARLLGDLRREKQPVAQAAS